MAVNTGYEREGIPWDDKRSVDLVKHIKSQITMEFAGCYSHCGNSYDAKNSNEINKLLLSMQTE